MNRSVGPRVAVIRIFRVLTAALCLAGLAGGAAAAGRLEVVRARNYVTCGILPEVAGFAKEGANGDFRGLDVDVCRAVAAAILGDAAKVKYVTASEVTQFRNSNEIDLVVRRITWSLSRAMSNGLMFGPITFYDGQGFMVPRAAGITEPKQLAGKRVCVQSQEAHITTLTSYFRANRLTVTPIAFDDNERAAQAVKDQKCAAYSADVSMLGAARASLEGGVENFDILPEMISREPLAPLVRQDDDQFFEIVRWSVFATIAAEEYGITSQNIDGAGARGELEIQQFLGLIPGNGAALGLDEKWAVNIVKAVGNYGEMFERNVGRNSPIKLERGLNKLWTDGGLMYAPRLR